MRVQNLQALYRTRVPRMFHRLPLWHPTKSSSHFASLWVNNIIQPHRHGVDLLLLQSNNSYYYLLPVIVLNIGSVSSSGVRYKPGSVLPRDAGSCLECQCGQNSQIACSPKDCITLNSLGDEDTSEPDFYGSNNGEQNNGNFNMDMFAVNVVWWKSSGEREREKIVDIKWCVFYD